MEVTNDEANHDTPMEAVQRKDQEKEIDRISTLPDELVHHIMSFLPVKDTARTVVLSKRWESLWLAYPIYEFDERCFQSRHDHDSLWFLVRLEAAITCKRKFYNYMRRSLTHRDFNDMKELRIITSMTRDYELQYLVTRCIAKAILQGKVQQLHLQLTDPPESIPIGGECDLYLVPSVIFSSASFLVSLTLEYCECRVYNKTSFPSLRNLSMRLVHVRNQQLQKMIHNSPQLDTLELNLCYGFDTMKIFNPKVTRLVVNGCWKLLAFEMDAPCLNYFNFNGKRRFFQDNYSFNPIDYLSQISEFKVANASNIFSLETLVLSFVKMNDETFRSMLSSFPNIKTMKLLSSLFGKMPSTPLEKLKWAEIHDCSFNAPVDINAQNLETFIHRGWDRLCTLRYLGGLGFCIIKTLSLVKQFILREDYLEELLSSCIFLENLIMKSCGILTHLKLTSSTLKTLVVQRCNHLKKAEIQAPQLEYFQYVGQLIEFSPIISSCDLDVELHIESRRPSAFDCVQLIKLKKLIRSFGDQARVLTIFSNSAEYVMFPEQVAEPLPIQPHLRRRLKDTSFLNVLLQIFRIPVCHETLWIYLGDTTIEIQFQAEDCSIGETHIPDYIQHHLNVVRLKNFDGDNNQMELLTHLLHKSQSLQFMFISFRKNLNEASFDRSNIVNRLMNYPKASPIAQIIFQRNALKNL